MASGSASPVVLSTTMPLITAVAADCGERADPTTTGVASASRSVADVSAGAILGAMAAQYDQPPPAGFVAKKGPPLVRVSESISGVD